MQEKRETRIATLLQPQTPLRINNAQSNHFSGWHKPPKLSRLPAGADKKERVGGGRRSTHRREGSIDIRISFGVPSPRHAGCARVPTSVPDRSAASCQNGRRSVRGEEQAADSVARDRS